MPGQLLLTISVSEDLCLDGQPAAGISVAVQQPILSPTQQPNKDPGDS